MSSEIIYTKKAPEPVGPYSQAIKAGDYIFCSGQIALDPETSKMVDGAVKEQTEQVFKNIKAVLKQAKCELRDVVKVDVFLESITDFSDMNEVYSKYFGEVKPARSTVEVSNLPKDALVEIAVTVYKPKP